MEEINRKYFTKIKKKKQGYDVCKGYWNSALFEERMLMLSLTSSSQIVITCYKNRRIGSGKIT